MATGVPPVEIHVARAQKRVATGEETRSDGRRNAQRQAKRRVATGVPPVEIRAQRLRPASESSLNTPKGGFDVSQQWNFKSWTDGNDICGQGMATEFDDHITSSGVPADLPGLVACSLPTGRCPATAASPFPPVPFGTVVKIYCETTKQTIYAPVIDEGPAWVADAGTGRPGSAMIDLTPAAVRALHMTDNALCTIRILHNQQYAADILHGLRAIWADMLD